MKIKLLLLTISGLILVIFGLLLSVVFQKSTFGFPIIILGTLILFLNVIFQVKNLKSSKSSSNEGEN